jgi:hypothetical protein
MSGALVRYGRSDVWLHTNGSPLYCAPHTLLRANVPLDIHRIGPRASRGHRSAGRRPCGWRKAAGTPCGACWPAAGRLPGWGVDGGGYMSGARYGAYTILATYSGRDS